jgi:hypothetical protein
MLEQRVVLLTGQVTDESPASVTITFGGVMAGMTTPDATGAYSYMAEASGLGTVTAVATDNEQLSSEVASGLVSSNAPSFIEFGAAEGPNRYWTFTGRVSDESPAGLIVRFGGGMPSLEGKTAEVQADGTFTLVVQLNEGEWGVVTADLIDWWGLEASQASYFVSPTPSGSEQQGG